MKTTIYKQFEIKMWSTANNIWCIEYTDTLSGEKYFTEGWPEELQAKRFVTRQIDMIRRYAKVNV